MTPKKKAQELIESMTFHCYECGGEDNAKQCALIAVDLLISETFLDFYVNHPKPFWQEVKTEIKNL